MKPLAKVRFDALAGYSRSPYLPLGAQELGWYEEGNERLLGVVSLDTVDRDYVSTVLAQDAKNRFRAVRVEINIPSRREAEQVLEHALSELVDKPASEFRQGDEVGRPMDFFTPRVPPTKLHAVFQALTTEGYSPALGVLRSMMHYFSDADGNFVEQFQSSGFDSRLWELYLFALLTELNYGVDRAHATPDFHAVGLRGEFFLEATTVNPSASPPADEMDRDAYFDHYVPTKYGSALRSKLQKRYWELPHVAGKPLLLAIQDFHARQAMVWSNTGLVEYLYGIKQTVEKQADGTLAIVSHAIEKHTWKGKEIPSGFFRQPETDHVSAVLANPGGTISKFNRIGFLAGFGSRSIKMIRGGYCYRGELIPEQFSAEVHDPEYSETWSEGLSIYHNPFARIPLPEFAFPGAAHHTARDGRILTSMPPFFPVGSTTVILVPE